MNHFMFGVDVDVDLFYAILSNQPFVVVKASTSCSFDTLC